MFRLKIRRLRLGGEWTPFSRNEATSNGDCRLFSFSENLRVGYDGLS